MYPQVGNESSGSCNDLRNRHHALNKISAQRSAKFVHSEPTVWHHLRRQHIGICSLGASNATVDFLTSYRLVETSKLETYAKSFVIEDYEDMDGRINLRAVS
ncbi:unnamed protein product [Protopolystoma xenopodis]|uniref:Uncharacterized protein n=1 Tax=Protopolystoma xenopodis TaxID=117903 RepID=A0A448WK73_9PLAT|nr:unnamed protein product [Protopolystoma xenopodis]